jgi:predicted membrane-bound spermidine synthase
MVLGRNKLIVIFLAFCGLCDETKLIKVGLYLTGNLEIRYQLIVDATRSSMRYDNLIEWRSRR